MNHTLSEGDVLVGRYKIERNLALGDFSVVYLVHDLHDSNAASLMVLKQRTLTSPDATLHEMIVRNYEREADILATLSHPAIPRIYDYFTDGNQSSIVMGFIQGKDLRSILEETEGFLPEEEVALWGIGICDALQYLHTHRPHPIIHRDVKPQHAIVDPTGRTHLVGFAIARAYQPGQKGSALGTQAYAPPEQFEGTPEPRSDTFALGTTLHHLLTGKPLSREPGFSDSDIQVRSLNPGVSMSMQAIVRKATQISPDDRFQTAKEMKLALIGLGY